MPLNDDLSEEVLTELLKKDARESSIKYSALGLEALLPKRHVDLTQEQSR